MNLYSILASIVLVASCAPSEFSAPGAKQRGALSTKGDSDVKSDTSTDVIVESNTPSTSEDSTDSVVGETSKKDEGEPKSTDPTVTPTPTPTATTTPTAALTCAYLDTTQAGKSSVLVTLPQPVVNISLCPNGYSCSPLELATSLKPVPAWGRALAVIASKTPTIDTTKYIGKGQQVGADYRFSTTQYISTASLPNILAGSVGYTEVVPQGGQNAMVATWDITIKNSASSSCEAVATARPISRGDVFADPSGCFAPDTKITLADGKTVEVALLRKGDLVLNPITGKGQSVKKIIYGPETDRGMMEVVTTSGRSLIVTEGHPFMTKQGLAKAQDLTPKSEILSGRAKGKDQFETVQSVKRREISKTQMVYNFSLESKHGEAEHHMVLANGIVTGDLDLQNQLANKTSDVAKSKIAAPASQK